jgi:HAD superfamily hydrolase (TIGR01509 family)
MMKKILNTTSWYEYECGSLTQADCYDRVAQQFRVDVAQVSEAFKQAHASLLPDVAIVNFLKDLRRKLPIKVYAMSNVAKEDFSALGDKMEPELFDRVFISGSYGVRKPQREFYCKVLEEICFSANEVVFVDDKADNVDAARRLGMKSLVFDENTIATLEELLLGPISRGRGWLYKNGQDFDSVTDGGVRVGDNFAKLLIADVTQDVYVFLTRT